MIHDTGIDFRLKSLRHAFTGLFIFISERFYFLPNLFVCIIINHLGFFACLSRKGCPECPFDWTSGNDRNAFPGNKTAIDFIDNLISSGIEHSGPRVCIHAGAVQHIICAIMPSHQVFQTCQIIGHPVKHIVQLMTGGIWAGLQYPADELGNINDCDTALFLNDIWSIVKTGPAVDWQSSERTHFQSELFFHLFYHRYTSMTGANADWQMSYCVVECIWWSRVPT